MEPNNVKTSDHPCVHPNTGIRPRRTSPAQRRLVGAAAWGGVRRTAVVRGGGRGRAGQVHRAPQHQVTHVAYREQHLRRERGHGFKHVPTGPSETPRNAGQGGASAKRGRPAVLKISESRYMSERSSYRAREGGRHSSSESLCGHENLKTFFKNPFLISYFLSHLY